MNIIISRSEHRQAHPSWICGLRLGPTNEWMCRAARLLTVFAFVLWGTAYAQTNLAASVQRYKLHNVDVGGDFVLTNQFGTKTSLEDFRGQVVVLFFGFTSCPDICPTTMAEMVHVLKLLGDQAKAARVIFITVDPERDTPERLKDYLAFFDETIVGLTGSVDEITHVTKRYSTRFRKQAASDNGDYSVDHTSLVYILDQKGQARYVLPYDAEPKTIEEGVRSLWDEER